MIFLRFKINRLKIFDSVSLLTYFAQIELYLVYIARAFERIFTALLISFYWRLLRFLRNSESL